MTDHYAVHGALSVEVSSDAAHIRDGYRQYLRHFQVDAPVHDVPVYRVHDFSTFRVPSMYRRYGPYVGFASGFWVPSEKYALTISDRGVDEYTTYANRATNVWVQMLLIPQGMSLAHGAGVHVHGSSFLFAGFGGMGKTVLVSALRRAPDFRLYGDDYVILNQDGDVYAYPADFSIYPYHLSAFPELHGTRYARYLRRRQFLYPYYAFQRAANFFARRFSVRGAPLFTGWNAPYVKVPAQALVPRSHIGTRERLRGCVVLTRYNGGTVTVEELTVDACVAALVGNVQIEFMHALPYLHLLHALNLSDGMEAMRRQERILRQCVEAMRRFRVSIPLRADMRAIGPTMVQQLDRMIG